MQIEREEKRGVLSRKLDTLKHKRSKVPDAGKAIGKIDEKICGTLPGQSHSINKCNWIGFAKLDKNTSSSQH